MGCRRPEILVSAAKMVEPGTNQKSPEPIDTNMVSEIEAQQLPPELPLKLQIPTPRPPYCIPVRPSMAWWRACNQWGTGARPKTASCQWPLLNSEIAWKY
jgi:hypothetical protein